MILKAENIFKSYLTKNADKTEVLKGLSLEVNKGDFISIQGASGSGKSTLLHCLGGLDKPDSGSVFISHKDEVISIYDLQDAVLTKYRNFFFGFVFQFHHLLPEFTALENVAMPALIGNTPKQEAYEKAQILLKRTGILEKANSKPQNMSGGEQQRVAIARALINNPEIILADEPTGNLDNNNSAQFLELIESLINEFNTTFIIATHSDDIAQRASKKLIIKNGTLYFPN
jgi:ABC-type lipoprotein export system ATPase subunit